MTKSPTERTWQIRDQMPNGTWSPERTVTLAQYRAEIEAAKARAIAIFNANTAKAARRRIASKHQG